MGGGGYVAGPVGLAAASLRLPLVLTEADSHLGLTNRLLAPLAAARLPGLPAPRARGRALPRHGPADPAARPRIARRRAAASASTSGTRACSCSAARSARARSTSPRSKPSRARPFRVLHISGRRDYEELAARPPRRGLRAASPTSTSRTSAAPWPRPTSRSRAPAARCSSSPPTGCRRSWSRSRARPATTRARTPAGWPRPARRS